MQLGTKYLSVPSPAGGNGQGAQAMGAAAPAEPVPPPAMSNANPHSKTFVYCRLYAIRSCSVMPAPSQMPQQPVPVTTQSVGTLHESKFGLLTGQAFWHSASEP
jgi:hypothetical protein